MSTTKSISIVFIFVASLWPVIPLSAQQYRATITGKVTDPSGSAVPGVDITVTGVGTNFVTTSKSDDSGNYAVPFLVPGTYDVKVSATGFATGIRNGVELHAGDKTQVDMSLQLGQATQAVTVEASGELLQTATASTGQVIDAQQTRDLPVLGRNTFMLATLATASSRACMGIQPDQVSRASSAVRSMALRPRFQWAT